MWDGQSEFSRKLEQYAVFNAGEVNLADTAQTLREEECYLPQHKNNYSLSHHLSGHHPI